MIVFIFAIIALFPVLNVIEGQRNVENLYEPDSFNSPCPEIFNYHLENGDAEYGEIKVQYPGGSVVDLVVEISVGNEVKVYKGDLNLLYSEAQSVRNLKKTGAIYYRIDFPDWNDKVPTVTKIILDGKLICQGPPINIKAVKEITKVTLKHTLTLEHVLQNEDNDIVTFRNEESITEYNTRAPRQTPPTISNQHTNRLNYEVCGKASVDNSLFYEGKETYRGQYPWLIAIYQIRKHGTDFLCGGSLISHKHVLTAAHCMRQGDRERKVGSVFVRIGIHNLRNWREVQEAETPGVQKIIVHPDYNLNSSDADIALLELEVPISFTTLIRPVCIWYGDKSLKNIVGKVGIVAGWGKDELFQISEVPKQVRIPIVSQVDCLRSHDSFRRITSKRTFCAGSRNGTGPCEGDSGGAFLLRVDDRWVLRGITSRSIAENGFCDFFNYAVFTDIIHYTGWMQRVIDASERVLV